jgi:hypothetical protein
VETAAYISFPFLVHVQRTSMELWMNSLPLARAEAMSLVQETSSKDILAIAVLGSIERLDW